MNYLLAILTVFILASCSNIEKKTAIDEGKSKPNLTTKIDSSNYYNFCSNKEGITTSWLESFEVVPILLQEIEKAGFQNGNDNILYELTANQFIVLTAYNTEPEFGFIYISDHEAWPSRAHRYGKNIAERFSGEDEHQYEQTWRKFPAKLERSNIKQLPKYIHLLQADCYWYQESEVKTNERLVSKEDAVFILRQDIQAILTKYSQR